MRVLVISLFACALPAQNRYVVELNEAPAAARANRSARTLTEARTAVHTIRKQVQAGQADVRGQVAAQGVKVIDSVDVVANALFVDAPAGKEAGLSRIPGVKRVYKARRFKPLLDHAVVVHGIDQVWSQIGVNNAGVGIKIAIVDSGVDNNHPGMIDGTLTVPAGFPKLNASSDQQFTNNKVIAARSYVSLLDSRDIDYSALDHVGHGTALAMTSAGVTNTGPYGSITGVAPKAWIGSYKIFGTPTYNDYSNDAAILKALDDAVADGMNIVSLSVGSVLAPRLADDPEVAAVEQATSLGVLVVVAAGNDGTDPNTISSPATATSAIAVGASHNSRDFSAVAIVSGLAPVAAINGQAVSRSPVAGQMADVAALDGTGLACSALPGGSLTGKIAFILRGSCTFETKLLGAQRAGAAGALVMTTQDQPEAIAMYTGAATIPAQMVSYSDGQAIKAQLSAGVATATLDFTIQAVSVDFNRISSFTSIGPNVNLAVKPDMLAVGTSFYTATEHSDTTGEMYDPSGYIIVDGTSFSTPLVAGSAALLEAARPGLTPLQYRSLLINSATPLAGAGVQQAGAGLLNVPRAMSSNAVFSPASFSFGAGSGDVQASQALAISNIGAADDTYTISVAQVGGGPAPQFDNDTLRIAAGATGSLAVSFAATGLAPGAYQGFVTITSANTGVQSVVPYWYAVASTAPAHVTVLDSLTSARAGSVQQDAILFRITDAAGVPINRITPGVTVSSGSGSIVQVVNHDFDVPGVWGITLRMGQTATNVFHITAGDVSVDVPITGR